MWSKLTLLLFTIGMVSGGGNGGDAFISPEHVSILMRTFLPSIFNLFSNVTDAQFKATFQPPCRFEQMLEMFQQLPPYFEQMAKKYPNDPELLAYYSMQLASTVLVNNGSLTMRCLYSMLTLQSRLNEFSLKIMDRPQEHPELVGYFGIFMKPIMSKLKDNAMMKIIEHVDKYDKNDNTGTIYLFKFLNLVYCVLGLGAIMANVFLVILLKQNQRSSHRNAAASNNASPAIKSRHRHHHHRAGRKTKRPRRMSNYDYVVQLIAKRYKTRICLIIIAICHSLYIFINYIIMSQAGLASVALQGLTQLNLACKMAFFLFPPTTLYTLIHQLAIWLLVYCIRKHAIKIRAIKASYMIADYERMSAHHHRHKSRSESPNHLTALDKSHSRKNNIYITESITDDFSIRGDSGDEMEKKPLPVPSSQYHHHHASSNATSALLPLPPTAPPHHHISKSHLKASPSSSYTTLDNEISDSCVCYFFSPKRKNALFCVCLVFILMLYNFQNFLFYSLNEMESDKKRVSFCAFDDFYSDYYKLITQYLVPVCNLLLFVFLPLLIAGVQVLLDASYLIRLKKEQTKVYNRLNEEHIEWPLYVYYVAYLCVFAPLFLHQVIDLTLGTKKFPFVFPLFIQLKFTSHVWLVVVEMTALFALCGMDLFIWLLVDKNMRLLASYWITKYILCRTKSDEESDQVMSEKKGTLSGSSATTSSGAGSSSSTPHSDSTEASSAKTSSDLCAIPDTNPHPYHNHHGSVTSKSLLMMNKENNMNGINGTLTSNASSLSRKKQLLPNITDAIKTTAAISAGIQHSSVYPYENTIDQQQEEESNIDHDNFKMIDNDIDQVEEFTTRKHLSLDIEDEEDDDLANDYINDENSEDETVRSNRIKYKSNYENVHPPSFKTAITRLQQQQHYSGVDIVTESV